MLRKYRQFVIGFLIGALVFTFIPANAAFQEYILTKSNVKIIVDGTEFTDDSLPILYYKGYNYIPAAVFRGICSRLGLSFDCVGETNEIQIKTKGEGNLSDGIGQTGNFTSDGLEIYNIDGIRYVAMAEVCEKYDKFAFGVSEKNGQNLALKIRQSGFEVIESLDFEIINYMTYVTVDYYENTIKPAIQAESSKEGDNNLSNTVKDGYNLLTVDGVEYISFKAIHDCYYSKGYNFGYDAEKKQSYFYHNLDLKHHNINKEKILLENVPTRVIDGMSHIEYSYFEKNILPLIK
ncbi:MAG TPA: hypothetical protein VFF25_02860 [Clostridia bacterium]|nr:hypothetical protein [Clostridia bacterium]